MKVIRRTGISTPEPAGGLARWFFHRCDRARAFFSIYMTLAGVLNIALLATLPRVLPGGFRAWSAPVWLVTVAGLAMTYTRGAWLGLGESLLGNRAVWRARKAG